MILIVSEADNGIEARQASWRGSHCLRLKGEVHISIILWQNAGSILGWWVEYELTAGESEHGHDRPTNWTRFLGQLSVALSTPSNCLLRWTVTRAEKYVKLKTILSDDLWPQISAMHTPIAFYRYSTYPLSTVTNTSVYTCEAWAGRGVPYSS